MFLQIFIPRGLDTIDGLLRILNVYDYILRCIFLMCVQGVHPVMSTPVCALGNPIQATSMSCMAGPEIVYSGKHNGICIYFSRIMG